MVRYAMAQAMNVDGGFTKQVSDVLDILGTGVYYITFSNRGRRQNAEVQKFKEAVRVGRKMRRSFAFFVNSLFTI